MDLWIRSQDKKSLRIVSNINIIHEDDKFFICNYTGIANIKLGKYEYEKRALEILNEIQEKIRMIQNPKDAYYCVYEMPEDLNGVMP